MPRIAGVTIPSEKRIEASLCYVYGIGPDVCKKILQETGIDPNARTNKLTEEELDKIRAAITTIKVEGDLRREVSSNIKRLKDISAYRGHRHSKGLPVRGQGTRTNARTRKGRKVAAGSGRKQTGQKT